MSAEFQTRPVEVPAAAEAIGDRSQRRFQGLLDVGVLVVLILLFLGFLMVLNHILFPRGARLGDLIPASAIATSEPMERGRLDIAGGNEFRGFDARLAEVRREVKLRPAEGIAWNDAEVGAVVRNRDALQTFEKSRARVNFDVDNELRIGQNSLVVFGGGAVDPFLARRDPAVVLLQGELGGRVDSDYGAIAAELPVGVVVVRAADDSPTPADFRLSVNPDRSSTIAVHAGQASITVAGQGYRIAANQALTVSEDGRTSGIQELPAAPAVRGPAADDVFWFRETPPRVDFRWDVVHEAQRYRLEIATDDRFEEILVDEIVERPSFTHGNLSAGEYHWRVSARNGWVQGPVSEPRPLRVSQDTETPVLEVEPIRELSAGSFELLGRTSSDATLYVDGRKVATAVDGSFRELIAAEPGARVIVVEAIDPVGNTAYHSEILHNPGRSH